MLSVLINTHLLMAATRVNILRFFFSSSACGYNADKQRNAHVVPLKEADAYPALAEDGLPWMGTVNLVTRRPAKTFDWIAAQNGCRCLSTPVDRSGATDR